MDIIDYIPSIFCADSVTIPMEYASSTTNMAVQSERMSIEGRI